MVTLESHLGRTYLVGPTISLPGRSHYIHRQIVASSRQTPAINDNDCVISKKLR